MNKIILLFVILETLIFPIYAKEPLTAILLNVDSNSVQRFNYGNFNFICEAYGVVSIEELKRINSENNVCQNSIETFYKKNKHLKYYSLNLLKIKQMYHVDFKENGCILYSHSQITLSESLLREGLAIIRPRFKNREFNYSFRKAQERAKYTKRGMWSENIPTKCIVK